ncbi:hypothetical protein NLM16_05135 [Bradyrhizobium brasilense]|uniref:Uncharacterized protein n=1 Tax=Bradyrhizobium brasilense TaxID=1419277 RepID=A0ABY8JB72_9BRAD|nr:hypothetical protein [Bradyrhizobium brasilense]MCP3413483.1 hypothetical protein [Bradyrhizobium brasilense]WFU62814.1 hypothetical protein QA636_36155 [Bradyrhizobium brasilense]
MRVIHHMAGRGLSGDDATFVTSGEMSKVTEDRPLREEGLLAGSEARSPSRGLRRAKLPENEHVTIEILSFGSGL